MVGVHFPVICQAQDQVGIHDYSYLTIFCSSLSESIVPEGVRLVLFNSLTLPARMRNDLQEISTEYVDTRNCIYRFYGRLGPETPYKETQMNAFLLFSVSVSQSHVRTNCQSTYPPFFRPTCGPATREIAPPSP